MQTDAHIETQNNTLQQLIGEYLKEKRRKRRWNIFFRTLVTLFIILVIFSFYGRHSTPLAQDTVDHAAIIDINGPIFDMARSNADDIAQSLRAAFAADGSQAVILRINSPGGSAVQADYIFNELLRLRHEHPDKPIYAVCTDVCASAAYYIAAAADEIYANPNSLVGSIGVIFNGFGFTDTMEKLGVERRLVTAGKYKGFMDPFSPINITEEEHLRDMLNSIYKQFRLSIEQGRGDRLADNDSIFSGLLWTGAEAQALGLIDGFASTGSIARELVGTETVLNYTIKPNYLERLFRELAVSATGEVSDRLGLSHQSIYGY